MQTFLIATGVVALAEIGDKTQLLSLLLAAKYRKPWPICIGILAATLVSHALAAVAGDLLARWLTPQLLHWIVVGSLLAMALWTLVPDKADDTEAERGGNHSVMIATFIAFFLAEMGDKTQIATAVLAAQYHPLWQIVAGSTLGMLIANVPVVWLGSRFSARLPLRATRLAAAALFAALALWVALR
ncbi:MAG TPA: TMEM165/GDT1 family protein [Rhodanobacteraceae bacterium]|nr:TMEM165/GDT1 family protein [Rhodanobacteraceae bacterium]